MFHFEQLQSATWWRGVMAMVVLLGFTGSGFASFGNVGRLPTDAEIQAALDELENGGEDGIQKVIAVSKVIKFHRIDFPGAAADRSEAEVIADMKYGGVISIPLHGISDDGGGVQGWAFINYGMARMYRPLSLDEAYLQRLEEIRSSPNLELGFAEDDSGLGSGESSGTDIIFGPVEWGQVIADILKGVAVGAAAAGLATLAGKVTGSGPVRKEEEDDDDEPDRVVRYVLNPSTDRLRLPPGSSASLEIAIWAITADGRRRVASEVMIRLAAPEEIRANPDSGQGNMACTVSVGEKALVATHEIRVSTQGGSGVPVEAIIRVEIQPRLRLEFF